MTSNADEEQVAAADSAPAGPASEEVGAPTDGAADAVRLGEELAALRERHVRLQAEFDNYRKRQQRERAEVHRQAKERLLREMPGVLDNLERALRHAAEPDAPPESLRQGVDLVARQIQEILARFGAEPMAALGTLFDPHLHEAMARVETSGDPPDGTVVEEYRRGWLLDGKVLRPALVAVAKLAEDEGESGS